MGRQNRILATSEGRIRTGFRRENIHASPGKMTAVKRFLQSFRISHLSSRDIDKDRALFYFSEKFFSTESPGTLRQRQVHGHIVAGRQKLTKLRIAGMVDFFPFFFRMTAVIQDFPIPPNPTRPRVRVLTPGIMSRFHCPSCIY